MMTKSLVVLCALSALAVPISETSQAASTLSNNMVQVQQAPSTERRAGPSNDDARAGSTSSQGGAGGTGSGGGSSAGPTSGSGEGTALRDKGETEAAAREQ
jgi:hypothetical protein